MNGNLLLGRNLVRTGFVTMLASGLLTSQALAGAIIFNTGDASTATIALGVNDEGHLNLADPFGAFDPGNATATGIAAVGIGDATSPGCLCEGWGVSGTVGGGGAVSGFANVSTDGGANNLTVDSFSTDAAAGTGSFATSSVHLTDTPGLLVEHAYGVSDASGDLFETVVTITNDTGSVISDLRYVRVMDWDVPPTEFSEFVTIGGTATTAFLERSHDDGFSTANPLGSESPISAATLDVDFADDGPADHGAYFRFNFGDLGIDESRTFNIYYGAAPTEAEAFTALVAESIELFSFGQNSGPDGETVGSPATFIFGFSAVGGTPVVPVPEPASLGILGLGLLGVSAILRRRRRQMS